MNLTDHFLIAWPNGHGPIFDGTVIYMCEHNPHGALGFIINKELDLTVARLLENLGGPAGSHAGPEHVMFGGPVAEDRGFALHSCESEYVAMLKVSDDISFTSSKDVLEAVAAGTGPKKVLVAIGYSGWGPGQLEGEIMRNAWLTVKADPAIVFDTPVDQRYGAAMRLLGLDPSSLVGTQGLM